MHQQRFTSSLPSKTNRIKYIGMLFRVDRERESNTQIYEEIFFSHGHILFNSCWLWRNIFLSHRSAVFPPPISAITNTRIMVTFRGIPARIFFFFFFPPYFIPLYYITRRCVYLEISNSALENPIRPHILATHLLWRKG